MSDTTKPAAPADPFSHVKPLNAGWASVAEAETSGLDAPSGPDFLSLPDEGGGSDGDADDVPGTPTEQLFAGPEAGDDGGEDAYPALTEDEGGEPPAPEPSAADEGKPETVEVTIDGKKVDVTLDELRSGYQRAKSAQKRFDEAAKLRKESQAVLQDFKGFVQALRDPNQFFNTLQQVGVDPRPLIDQKIREYAEEYKLSPEEAARRRLMQEKQAFEAAKQREATAKRQQELAASEQRLQSQMFEDFKAAIAAAGLPLNGRTIAGMSSIAQPWVDGENQYDPSMAREAAAIYAEELDEQLKERVATMPPEKLADYLGEEGKKRWRRWDIAELKKRRTATKASVDDADVATEKPKGRARRSNKPIKLEDFRKALEDNPIRFR